MGQSSWKLLRGEDLQTIQEEMATLEVEEEAKIGPVKVLFLPFIPYLPLNISLLSFFFVCQEKDQFCLFLYLPAKGPILPFSLFASIGGENGQSGGFGFGAGDFYGPGGFGSGLDIATIPMKNFILT